MDRDIYTTIDQDDEYDLKEYSTKQEKEKPKYFKTYGLNQSQNGGRGEEIPAESINVALGRQYVLLNKFSSTSRIDLNSLNIKNLFRVPNSKKLIVTDMIVRKASAAITTASFSIGYNSGSFDNVIGSTIYSSIANDNEYIKVDIDSPSVVGDGGQVLKVNIDTPEGSALTITLDILGYLI